MKIVSVVLPTYNEKDNIEKFIDGVLDQEKELPGWKIEIIVADDVRTSDGTDLIVKKLASKNSQIHYLQVEPGLGVGLITAHLYALKNLQPDIMAQMDADGQVEIDILPRMVKTIEEGYTYVQGSRFVKGGKNNLSISRRFFSATMSLVVRIIMGPWDFQEFANSARAFTPQLFSKINLNRLPWKQQTFIIQPAFVHEAMIAGAKYKEIPLIFKDRAEGYSKNKIINYSYDVLTYVIEARLHKWGIKVPFFKWSHKAKVIIKFSVVGFTGTIVDLFFYNLFIRWFGFVPAVARLFSASLGIVNNFTWNSLWTFKGRQTTTKVWQRFLMYCLVSTGAIFISISITAVLDYIYGEGILSIFGLKIAYHNIIFLTTIPPVMAWNFTINHFVTWRRK
ncbi:hypothetical protein A2631_03035 [Candidatus Daviesbacteria bacterium RIFCSPHIGHO2_01_FULL_44_29]|uniref:Glycosyltransferase 2-like domain-containing protein n=1 Tax=Candidatus Daviesbacteria bacterium RIFCSPHIGHO2_02_FULL_43_12 TaxID=1797776 RepID=A0A1F5KK98_9BACT|nr:MAG: hypothetical protein A2631_03035 [Candidatus Daviesbacteria bacterium RIFCSPHIGHO2_01_FULL_44_29]OGE40789.1 MAG: hypothetical protein A3E86_02310 [Candidatus Daviesbacteria bacterium RIFCSPHIGHO2_12_FULL_47_45]OGE41358.1 MAG: hypothetical protein A3D25_02430 [Candidatus Daviesbacteria bacterium RIFCSPHIGHO2_02_FULL_43_12]OGE69559.1 MAG: hypothetical protein A3B55_04175 [Candidatus Daviesbacteria bacterium RIFCSPLOWO2_01_FULL_43_15]